jgi:hypothetical protein
MLTTAGSQRLARLLVLVMGRHGASLTDVKNYRLLTDIRVILLQVKPYKLITGAANSLTALINQGFGLNDETFQQQESG